MPERNTPQKTLESWKQIAAYLAEVRVDGDSDHLRIALETIAPAERHARERKSPA